MVSVFHGTILTATSRPLYAHTHTPVEGQPHAPQLCLDAVAVLGFPLPNLLQEPRPAKILPHHPLRPRQHLLDNNLPGREKRWRCGDGVPLDMLYVLTTMACRPG